MKERLLTLPFEEQEMKSKLRDIIDREQKTTALREKLEIKYQAAVEAKQSEVNSRLCDTECKPIEAEIIMIIIMIITKKEK